MINQSIVDHWRRRLEGSCGARNVLVECLKEATAIGDDAVKALSFVAHGDRDSEPLIERWDWSEAQDEFRRQSKNKTGQAKAGLEVVPFSEIKAKPIKWLWQNRIALGKVTVLAGNGGLGKSTILCDLAARTCTGSAWPDGAGNGIAGSVLILAAEDAEDDTIKPRLEAHGADMKRTYCIRGSICRWTFRGCVRRSSGLVMCVL